MPTTPDPKLPDELLRGESEHAKPRPPERPGILGFPAFPESALDLAIQYGPYLVFAGSLALVFTGLLTLFSSGSSSSPESSLLPFSGFLSLVAGAIGVVAYFGLAQRRRLGWNLLAIALVIQFIAQFMATGVQTVLYAGVELFATAYIMLAVRDSFWKE